MKIASIMWNSYIPMLAKANEVVGFELKIFSNRTFEENPAKIEEALSAIEEADLILLYRTSDLFWEGIEKKLKELGKRIPVVCLGYDPSFWILSTVKPEIVATSQSYITINGEENLRNMLCYLGKEVLGMDLKVELPEQVAWEGLYHPDAPRHFESIDEYLKWYKLKAAPTVGILFSRISWINNSLDIENTLIKELEKRGLNVIPAFSYSVKDEELGTKGQGEIVQEYFMENGRSRIDVLVKLLPFFIGQNRRNMGEAGGAFHGVKLLKKLNVPVFQPIISTYITLEDRESSNGLTNDTGWSVAMPEFEGVIEPIIIGANSLNVDFMQRLPIEERCSKLAQRVLKWMNLGKKPINERKVAFILHNNPCALEEIARRLLEAYERELWSADPEVLHGLKNAYLEIEGWMEERAGEGEFQGGAVDIMTALEVEGWGDKMKAVMEKIHNKNDKRYRK